jgi:hypothetical protein
MPEEVKHGVVVHHFAWHHQDSQNDASLPSVYDVVGVIAQMNASPFQAHWRGIRIGGTDAKICRSLVGTIHVSLLPTFFRNPVVASRILLDKFLALCLRDPGRQRDGR